MRLHHPDGGFCGKVRMLVACALAGMLGLLPASALGAQACVQLGSGIGGTGAPQGGIGGTGTPAAGGTGGTGDWAGSGLGGTGAVAGGIGGTGDQADSGIGGTGIVGTITGFASVCIGELEVHFDAATSVSMNGQPGNLNQLALGQVVAMEAVRGAKGLTARTIAILNALEGPVTRAEAARGVLEVMGQPVRLTTGVDALRIAAGASVRVSGLRDVRGVVHATRVETAADLREASAIGFLRGSGGAVNLDGLSVVGVGGAAIRGELLVRGQWDGRQLLVRERCADPSLPFAGRVRDVVVEGLVHRRSALSLQISGFEVQLSSAARLGRDAASGIAEGSRVRIVGRIESGRRIIASRVEIERGRSGADDRTGGRGKGRRSDESTDDGRSSGSDNRGGDNRRSDDGSKRDSRSGERNEGSGDRGSRMEKVEKSDKVEKAEKPEIAEKVERVEKVEKLERSGKVDSAAERVEKAVRPESGRSGRN